MEKRKLPWEGSTYLVIDEKKDGNYFKIGSASNIDTRKKNYKTHNPLCSFIDVIESNNMYHREYFYQYQALSSGHININNTEWFLFNDSQEKFDELKEKGFNYFEEYTEEKHSKLELSGQFLRSNSSKKVLTK